MKTLVGAALAATLIAGSTAAAPAPLMKVLIKPSAMNDVVGKGVVDVTLSVPDMDVAAGAPLLSLAVRVPGMAKPLTVEDLSVTDATGLAPVTSPSGEERSWTSARAIKGDIVVRYRLPIENTTPTQGGPPINPRIDGDGFSSQGAMLLMSPQTKAPYRVAIQWDLSAMGPGAEGVTSYGDGDVEIPAGPVKRLSDIVLMAGHIHRAPEKNAGAFSAVWLGDPPFDPRPAMAWTAQLHKWMSSFFRDNTEPPYRVFLRYNPMNAGGGAALTHSFIATYGTGVTGENLKSILGHEMTHTWTANDIGKWYDEGDAVFYQARLPWRAGLISTDQFLADLNETASRYYTNAMMHTPEDQVAPHFWEDTRIRVLPYDRGAMYFAVLDGKIRKASGGKRSVDDLIQTMIERARTDQPLNEAVWVDLLRKEIGEDGPAIHRSMMAGGLMLPDSDEYGPCLRRTTRKIRRFDLGFDGRSLTSPSKIIHGLEPGSEAAKAGLHEGDKVSYGVALDAVQAEVRRMLTLHVTRDGKTFDITYPPRGEAVDAYQWKRIPGAPETGCAY
jgi:predicted metalloprotease with PDZ domain